MCRAAVEEGCGATQSRKPLNIFRCCLFASGDDLGKCQGAARGGRSISRDSRAQNARVTCLLIVCRPEHKTKALKRGFSFLSSVCRLLPSFWSMPLRSSAGVDIERGFLGGSSFAFSFPGQRFTVTSGRECYIPFTSCSFPHPWTALSFSAGGAYLSRIFLASFISAFLWQMAFGS